ncbi:MAG: tetratricopeptide repeat protein [Polyangiales bacterium]
MRLHLVLMLALALFSGCDDDPATQAPENTEVSEVSEESEAPAPEAEAPTEDSLAETRRLLRDGRRAASAGNLDEARTHFDALLRAAPEAPRFWCEAGFVSLRAERFDEAERRLDHGLALYGPIHRISESLREALAMCLYNRGRVEDDRGDDTYAVDYYENSLRLRENATVRQRLEAALTSHLSADPESHTFADVEVDGNGLFKTQDREALAGAMSVAFRGYREFADEPVDSASVSHEASAQLPGGDAHVFSIVDESEPTSSVMLGIALPRAGGYKIITTDLGLMDADGDRHTLEVENVSASISHGLVRVDFSVQANSYYVDMFDAEGLECVVEGSLPSYTEQRSMVCTTDGTHQCVSLVRGVSTEPRTRLEADCTNEAGESVAAPANLGHNTEAAAASYALTLSILPEGRLRMSRESGEVPESAKVDETASLREWIAEGPIELIEHRAPSPY